MARIGAVADDRSMSDTPSSSSSSSGLSITWQGLAAIPQLLADTRQGVATLHTLLSAPAAAAATGSPPASIAIIALGVELAVFLAENVKAIDEDIETITHTARRYQATEADVERSTATVLNALIELTAPTRPALATTATRDRVVAVTR